MKEILKEQDTVKIKRRRKRWLDMKAEGKKRKVNANKDQQFEAKWNQNKVKTKNWMGEKVIKRITSESCGMDEDRCRARKTRN